MHLSILKINFAFHYFWLPIYIESRENLSLLNDENIRRIRKISKTLMSSSNIWRIQINLLVFTKFTFPVLWRRLFLLWRLVVICACVKTITSFVRHPYPSSNRNFSGLSEKKISEMLRLPSTRGYPNISKRQIHTDVTATSKRTWRGKLSASLVQEIGERSGKTFICLYHVFF